MSRSQRGHELAATAQLKKELNDARSAIQTLSTHLESLEANLIDSQQALAKENTLREQVSSLQHKVDELQIEIDKKTDSFATTVLALDMNFGKRLSEFKAGLESSSQEEAAKHASSQNERQVKINELEQEIDRLRTDDKKATRELENQLKKSKKDAESANKKFEVKFAGMTTDLNNMRKKNDDLGTEVDQQIIVIKGLETTIKRQNRKLASFEAFTSIPDASIQKTLRDLESRVGLCCQLFVDLADVLPGWRHIPTESQMNELPRIYSIDLPASRAYIKAVIQHSLCSILVNQIFVSGPFCACNETVMVADTMHHSDKSRAAVWRLMRAATILQDDRLIEQARTRFRSTAERLVVSWGLHPSPDLQDQVRKELMETFVDCLKSWLKLMMIRESIYATSQGGAEYFDAMDDNDPEDSHKVPGDFTRSHPTLCLFPAFLQSSSTERTMQNSLLRKGVVLYPDSAVLAQACEDAKEVNSPRASRRMTFTSTTS